MKTRNHPPPADWHVSWTSTVGHTLIPEMLRCQRGARASELVLMVLPFPAGQAPTHAERGYDLGQGTSPLCFCVAPPVNENKSFTGALGRFHEKISV